MFMYVVIRIRGSVSLRDKLKDTLKMFNLHRVNHAVIVPEGKSYLRMIKKVEPFVTFGEINTEILEKMVVKRGRTLNGKKLDEEFLKKNKFKSFKELAEALTAGKLKLRELGMKPVFRLHPPKKGYERAGIKKNYSIGGAAGYRAADINLLLKKML